MPESRLVSMVPKRANAQEQEASTSRGKMKLEIVVHCLNYPRLLCFYLNGLIVNPPPPWVKVTLFTADDDAVTREVVEYFVCSLDRQQFDFQDISRPREQVGRRTILRNEAAKATMADWVLFNDVDYLFGPKFWEYLPVALAAVPQDCPLAFPRRIMASRTNEEGNKLIHGPWEPPCAVELPPADHWAPQKFRYAVGGVQFARGNYCRKNGYCDGQRKHLRPSREWIRTREDRAFRAIAGTSGHGIEVQELFRLRHSLHSGLGGQFDN